MTPIQTEYCTIPLTQGQVAIVDAADYEWLGRWKWQAHWDPGSRKFYAVHALSKKHGGGNLSMHRVILGLEKGDKRQGDHINLNGLDNRRENLRVATIAQNVRNSARPANNTSGYKGVSLDPRSGNWQAKIVVDRRRINLGTYSDPRDAAAAYGAAAIKYHGEFARIA